jgi:hypothetical protein
MSTKPSRHIGRTSDSLRTIARKQKADQSIAVAQT